RNPDRIVVVGDGPLRRAVHDADRRVVTVGLKTRPEALAWISAADVLVSASRDEGAPTAIREARALRVPVLAAPCGDLEEWAKNDSGIEIVRELRTRAARNARDPRGLILSGSASQPSPQQRREAYRGSAILPFTIIDRSQQIGGDIGTDSDEELARN